MPTRELHVTIRVDHEPYGVRAEATLRDDGAPVIGVGWLDHQPTNPFPAREDLAVVRALRDLAVRLVARGKQAHPCAPGGNGTAHTAAAGGCVPVQRWPTHLSLAGRHPPGATGASAATR
jgi:hypothetical protein